MMNNVLLSIKTDAQTKRDLQAFAKELGVTSTAFVNMVVRQALRERRVVLDTGLQPTPYLAKVIKTADKDYKNNKDITHTKSPAETLAHLDSLMN